MAYGFIVSLISCFVILCIILPTSNRYNRTNEIGIVIFLGIVSIFGFHYLNQMATFGDYEILNGSVKEKKSVIVPCEHKYKCGEVCSGSGSSRTCTPIYCDLHAFDQDWVVKSDFGSSTKISRVDSQGLIEPSRFSKVIIGEPYSSHNTVLNYFIGNKENFNTSQSIITKYDKLKIEYPDISDYYRVNTVVNLTDNKSLTKQYNDFIREKMQKMGSSKQVNVVLVITNDDSKDFFNALMYKWKGGKKNDVILVYSIDNESNIKWFESNTFANGQSNRYLIDSLRSNTYNEKLDVPHLEKQFGEINDKFKRLSNSDLEYMKDSTVPSILFMILFGIGESIILFLSILLFRRMR